MFEIVQKPESPLNRSQLLSLTVFGCNMALTSTGIMISEVLALSCRRGLVDSSGDNLGSEADRHARQAPGRC
jgi:hypothetical protein